MSVHFISVSLVQEQSFKSVKKGYLRMFSTDAYGESYQLESIYGCWATNAFSLLRLFWTDALNIKQPHTV